MVVTPLGPATLMVPVAAVMMATVVVPAAVMAAVIMVVVPAIVLSICNGRGAKRGYN